MQYIDYFEWILNSDFLQKGDNALTMIEPPDLLHKEQRVEIKNNVRSISDMKLYCFNTPETNVVKLFPFFNHRKDEPKAPKELNRFCDYMLLVQHEKGLFVFFIEMKRGDKGEAKKQLEASSMFFDYILQTADRIKIENGFRDFDPKQVKRRKIIICEERSNKRITKDNKIEDLDMNSVIPHSCYDDFRPIRYCERN